MLEYVTTNLFESPAQTLVNTVNTVGVMGKGIALDFKRRYPDMFRLYKQFCQSGQLDVGRLYLYRSPNKWVMNFPTKTDWRKPSHPDYVRKGLEKFVETYVEQGITSISFPQLGCGNGGLDWEGVVRPMMHEHLSGVAIPVYVHVLRRPQGFVAEHLDKAAVRELRRPRERISFSEFFSDVRRLAGVTVTGTSVFARADADEEPLALPAVRVPTETGYESVAGEIFEDVWHSLTMTGTARLELLPGPLRGAVQALLLQLDYLEPMAFEDLPGIRFSPAAASEPDAKSISMSAT
jgi:O-acetyl-ADP-ribose deacetylase (regulator of RNase III)